MHCDQVKGSVGGLDFLAAEAGQLSLLAVACPAWGAGVYGPQPSPWGQLSSDVNTVKAEGW